MDLAASGVIAGLVVATVVETGAGYVLGHLTMMAQFIFTTASFHLRVDPEWQHQGCLQCTSTSLPCGVKCQGSLAAK